MEIQSVIVSKPYSATLSTTTSTYRGIGHSIARLAESENNDNQLATNQFYGNPSEFVYTSHLYIVIIHRNFYLSFVYYSQ